ncbi:MAG: DUF5040 domain-containing protein [Alistipes sp.]|nr:DUF5040 domain-containing protein [Alistipes sp.]
MRVCVSVCYALVLAIFFSCSGKLRGGESGNGDLMAQPAERGSMCIIGASIACPENTWFEMACESLGKEPINKACSGTRPGDDVVKMSQGTLFAKGEHDKFEIFAVMHCHEMEICDESKLLDDYNEYLPASDMDYSQAFDYIIRKYADECRALEFDSSSKWYGFEGGKPVKIVLCTHWHDARPLYNGAVRRLVEKWSGSAYLCAFDTNIGFTKDEPDPETGEQMSLRYAKNGINDTEYLYGVLHGWHPTRGRDAEIQQRMAKIFADACAPLVDRK